MVMRLLYLVCINDLIKTMQIIDFNKLRKGDILFIKTYSSKRYFFTVQSQSASTQSVPRLSSFNETKYSIKYSLNK